MQFFYEFFPVFLFFITFKYYGIYLATVLGMITTLIQVILMRLWLKKWDSKQLITLSMFLLFGGMTLYFHNPLFIKWKPTVIFWLFSVILLCSQYLTKKPLMQRLLEPSLQQKGELSDMVWKRLNWMWVCFFGILGSINLYVAYHYSDDAWVNFKFYGVTGLLFIFTIAQALYMLRYLSLSRKCSH